MQIDNPVKQKAIIQPREAIPDQKILQNLKSPTKQSPKLSNSNVPTIPKLSHLNRRIKSISKFLR